MVYTGIGISPLHSPYTKMTVSKLALILGMLDLQDAELSNGLCQQTNVFFHNKLARTEHPHLHTWKWKAYQDRNTHMGQESLFGLSLQIYWTAQTIQPWLTLGSNLGLLFPHWCSCCPLHRQQCSKRSCFTKEQRPFREANSHPAVLKFFSKGKLALFSYLTKSYSSLNPPETPCL